MNLIYIDRILHPITEEYIFFSGTHGTFSTIDNTLWPKSLKIEMIEILSSIFYRLQKNESRNQ